MEGYTCPYCQELVIQGVLHVHPCYSTMPEAIQLTREQEILDCLYDLYSVQNGCPLPGKYDRAWNDAMRLAERLLGIEAKEPDHEHS